MLRRGATLARRATSIDVDALGVATITLDNGKVNMMDRVLMPELIDGVKQCSKDGVKGFIVQSHKQNIFCAGLDIRQLHNKPRDEMEDFWHLLQDSWFTLYNLDQPMVAAVNGAAIAGGCLIACTADRRLMLRNTKVKLENKRELNIQRAKLAIRLQCSAW